MKVHSIKVPIYNRVVKVVYAKNMKGVGKKYDLRDGYKKYDAFCFRRKDHIYVVFQNKSQDIIVHESVHIVNMILNDIHAELDLTNDEHQAYLTSWIFNKIHKLLY